MFKKSVSTIAILALAPLLFACAHATMDEGADGYSAVESEESPALIDPETVAAMELEQAAETSPQQVASAQKSVTKKGKTHKKISDPFVAPTVVTRAVTSAPSSQEGPQSVVTRNGSTLNRYYFLRAGDTPESLSKMFYGAPDRAAELVEWNGPAVNWQPGGVVYFRSGTHPSDETLISFYTEAKIDSETVILSNGESLQTLADKRYGSSHSWKEIAVLNGLKAGAQPSAGTSLKVYPFPLVNSAPSVVAQMQTEATKTVPLVKEERLASTTSLSSFIHHNPLLVACSSVVLVLFTVFFFMQRRRYRSRFDF